MATAAAEPAFRTSGVVRLTRSQLFGTMAGLMLALLVAAIDQTFVGTAEPRIIAQLSGFDRYPWVATAYLLTSTIAVPIFARLSDMHGRKWYFLAGTAIFVLTSALCGASGDLPVPLDGMSQLIISRAMQGVGAGMMMGLVFTIIGDIFSPAERGHYQGTFAAVWGFASMFGPTMGGWLTDHVSWRAAFYVNLPVGAIALAAIYFGFPDIRPQGVERRLDWSGVATLILCIVPLLLALTWVTGYGWTSNRVEVLLLFAALMLVAFLYLEAKAAEPLIPLSLFRHPVISICSTAVFVLGMGMFGVIMYLPLFMQGVLGVSATQSGGLLTPLMMGAVAGSIVTGQLNARVGSYKPSAVAGSLLVAAGMIQFARLDASTTHAAVVTGMVVAGLGMGLLNPVYTVAVQNAAPHKYLGAASASTTFFRSIGSTLGVAIFGSVLLTHYNRELAALIPPGIPDQALKPFSNPLMLAPMRPLLEATFSTIPDGQNTLLTLLAGVRKSLVHGLHLIFVSSAVIMTASVTLHLLLPNIPLRKNIPRQEPETH